MKAIAEGWIDVLPVGWDLVPAKAAFAERREPNRPDDVHLTPSQIYGVLPQAEYMARTGNSVVQNIQGQDNMKHVEPDDFIIHLRSFQGGIERSEYSGKVSTAYTVLKPSNRVVPRYFRWLLKSHGYIQELRTTTNQLRDGQSIKFADFAKVQLPCPPHSEQRAIADYLDRETARIDTLIEEQQRLIEMLRERRGAAISNAVARGLEEAVALKDSGLPGAGPVPVHWEVLPLRYTISFQEGPGIMAADFRDEGVPLLRVSCVRTARSTLEGCNYLDPAEVDRRWSHFRVDLGDLLISASASMGTVSEVTEETAGAVPYTGIIRIKPGRMHKDFIRWFVVSGEFIDQVDSLKTGSTIQHFGPTHLAQMRVALPPTDEQRQIAAHLDEQTARIDTLIVETERFIELARERRSALITAAVTGQIDVQETS
ncbi:restriction endonuclease subunit S [Rhodococcus pyridinivorans]|uniref:Type I restriction-modification system n=1 Tax=Rhodococcus pyridinivorans AK37 TaxID=1114960 RepID=H0JU92_9NOCA|nr:restriction endonuclease subunit S [Rhodococcus pyridinivorans]EHK82287.1 type I restriction-modification system [Rhodococcus pyridinivorans AK37]